MITGFQDIETMASINYKEPEKQVFNIGDMEKWNKSEAYTEYIGFIIAMNEAVRGKSLTFECPVSETTKNLLNMLDQMEHWVEIIPPIDQPQRFGNKAFQTWFSKLNENAGELLKQALPDKFHPAIVELKLYLTESVGNYTRIDYGTGHEMAFAMFLYCLFKIGALQKEDSVATVNKIFNNYIRLMRKLQITYRMEPAGSHGVWSLDDFHFLPFLWGSSQFQYNPKSIDLKDFTNAAVAEKLSQEFMFMSCIHFINQVKTGPFAEHSNQLWNISGVSSWSKVNSGLIKMYKAEVLSKFPVIQHVRFGTILPINQQEKKSLGPPTLRL